MTPPDDRRTTPDVEPDATAVAPVDSAATPPAEPDAPGEPLAPVDQPTTPPEPPAEPVTDAQPEPAAEPQDPATTTSVARSWRTLRRAFAPRTTRAQLVVGLLCLLLGFALAVQVRANRDEGLASLRQDELVRILDEVTQRHDELEQQAATLRAQRAELVTGTDTERAAQQAARERAVVQGILAGQLPVEGPGVRISITAPDKPIPALVLYNVLEELRNAGAEAVQLNDLRLTASSYIVDVAGGVVVDGQSVTPPYRWLAIGDPDTIIPALNMPGGAMSSVRNATGEVRLEGREHVEITATRSAMTPRWATPAPEETPSGP